MLPALVSLLAACTPALAAAAQASSPAPPADAPAAGPAPSASAPAPAPDPVPPAASSATSAGGPDRTTEQGEAHITDPTQECTPYTFAPLEAVLKSYPPLFTIANFSHKGVLQSDVAVFASVNGSIPKIAPEPIDKSGDIVGKPPADDPNCWWTSTLCTTPKLAGLERDITSCPEPNTWGFTLDDGPNCSHNAFYDFLASVEQKATLFYIGSNVATWPLEAQRGLADGHEVCAHTWSHQPTTGLSNEEAFAELYYSKKILHDVLGVTVTCWRPPFGDVDDRVRFMAAQLGMKTIIWDNDTNDFAHAQIGTAGVTRNYEGIISGVANGTFAQTGTVVLSHELDSATMAFSEQFLPAIQGNFTGGVMPVGACQNFTAIYAEQAFAYPNYAEWLAGTRTISVPTPSAASSELPFASGSVVVDAGSVASAGVSAGASSLAAGQLSAQSAVPASVGASIHTATVGGTGIGPQATAAAASAIVGTGATGSPNEAPRAGGSVWLGVVAWMVAVWVD